MDTILRRTYTSLTSGYRRSLLSVPGERFEKSENDGIERDGNKTRHSCSSDESPDGLTSREKSSSVERAVLQGDRHGGKRAKKQRNESSLLESIHYCRTVLSKGHTDVRLRIVLQWAGRLDEEK